MFSVMEVTAGLHSLVFASSHAWRAFFVCRYELAARGVRPTEASSKSSNVG